MLFDAGVSLGHTVAAGPSRLPAPAGDWVLGGAACFPSYPLLAAGDVAFLLSGCG